MATTVKELFEHLVHVGHNTSRWNPKMHSYLYGKRNGVHIFDLEKTLAALEKVQSFLKTVKAQGGKVLFVGTKPQAAFIIQELVKENPRFFYIDENWSPGFLTNFHELRKRADYYLNLKSQFESGEIRKYTKKEIARFQKELDKLDKVYHGVAELRRKPDVIIVLDSVSNRLAIEEANITKIPVIAIVDSNADPDGIDYPIPANDDSVKSIRFLVKSMLESLE